VVIFVCIIAAVIGTRSEINEALASVFYMRNWALAFHWLPEGDLTHTWSLAAEEQFYLIWPVLFVLIGTNRAKPFLLVALGTAFVWRLLLWKSGAGMDRIYGDFFAHSDPIIIGCLIGLSPTPARLTLFCGRLAPIAVSLIIGFAIFAKSNAATTTWAFFAVGICSATTLLGRHNFILSPLLSFKAVTFTGRISYGIYLWHYPLLHLAGHFYPLMPTIIPVVAAYALAALSYFTLEVPFRRWKTRGAAIKSSLPAPL
jgi:peptidoglycan/LPS O-acetylase OafA/YrhL